MIMDDKAFLEKYRQLLDMEILQFLPCKKGDRVYSVDFHDGDGVYRVTEMRVKKVIPYGCFLRGRVCNLCLKCGDFVVYRSFDDIDRTVFLSLADAERAMEEFEKAEIDFQKAVEKQVAKKPFYYDTKFRQRGAVYGECVSIEAAYNCPCCNLTVWSSDKSPYCEHCGQRLDWDE